MTSTQRKRIVLITLGVLVLLAITYGFLPDPVAVETAVVERGPLHVIVEEEGVTQVANRYVISSPVPAFMRRIDLEVGDVVQQGQPVVRLEPPRSSILDPRTRAEMQARLEAAQATLTQVQENARAATASAARAAEERQRVERLFERGSATQQQLQQATAEAEQAAASQEAAQAAVVAARAELAVARAVLAYEMVGNDNLPVNEALTSPIAGRVLAVPRRDAGTVNAGEPLLEVGDTDSLEVHVDVLSQDAVRIHEGTRVFIEQWGGDAVLEGRVKRVEPSGFTRVSSLGVEEQRVTVVAAITSPQEARQGLGAGYRVLARFVVWEDGNVLQVPTSALFRTEDGWAVFAVDGGGAVRRPVEVGQQTGLMTEVRSGLHEGDAVIVHPANAIEEGTRVAARE